MMPAIKKTPPISIPLRIVVLAPPQGILWALQLGRDELLPPASSTPRRITFDFAVELMEKDSTGVFRLRGPAVQGRPGGRFVYLCIGAYAGQPDAPAGWRAKVGLEGISMQLVRALRRKPGGRLEAQFAGTAPDGGPSRATVSLLGKGWHLT